MCAVEKVVCGMGVPVGASVFYVVPWFFNVFPPVFCIGDREGRGGVFRRLCVGMILGWDFYWF